MKRKELYKNFLAVCLGLVMVFLALELFFTFIIPASNSPESFYDEADKIVKFKPNTEGTMTLGPWAEQPFYWHINNAGWNNLRDYDADDNRPLIAVIGDSYIQPIGVDIDKSYPVLLQEKLKAKYRVYQFGMSGAPLSQYLHMSRYVTAKYKPDIIIFNIVHNDFIESLSCYTLPGRNYMAIDSSSKKEVFLPFHSYLGIAQLARKSNLICYLMRNLKINSTLVHQNLPVETFDLMVDMPKQTAIREKVEEVTDLLLTRMKNENPDSKLVFVMDGLRTEIELKNYENKTNSWLNRMMKDKVEALGIPFLDLTDYFQSEFNKNNTSFSSKVDPHWNNYGHHKVYEALYPFLLENGIIE
ncbi:SGNH/GDSL hydrolase family protein [uncultured Arcticibacterium sp.]|uniref:SGNH/GDSL hydrolase family protein n=1 Tax=uncultured Arcticibacterium sp. TaxID=2173042 RepID=UPI0030FA216F